MIESPFYKNGKFEDMPTGEERCECCDCNSFDHRFVTGHRHDPDECGECHRCEKPIP